MHRIDNATAVAVPPTPKAPGTPGYYTGGNPAGGIPATIVEADHLNTVQEEIAAVIEDTGITLAKGNNAQLLAALDRRFGGAVRTVTANTALTVADAGLILASAASGSVSITLPPAGGANGRPIRLTIVRTDTSPVNDVTLVRAGVDTVNGTAASEYEVPVNARLTLISDGASNWELIGCVGVEAMLTMSSGGNLTSPWWARRADIALWGGGGGGGYGGTGGAGGGGAGGSVAWGIFRILPRTTFTITIGAGGAGGTAAGVNGSSGGTTSFGSLVSAPGGGGGGSTASGLGTAGAAGGAPSGGAISAAGTPGTAGLSLGGTPLGGVGGSPLGGGAGGASTTSGGRQPTPPGGGGGGGANGNAGAAGQTGWMRVTWRP